MSGTLAIGRGRRKGLRSLACTSLRVLAGTGVGPPLRAQPSASCQVAVTAYVATQVELEPARKAHRRCKEEGVSGQVEFARIQDLQQRLKMVHDYIERYCTR